MISKKEEIEARLKPDLTQYCNTNLKVFFLLFYDALKTKKINVYEMLLLSDF